MLPPLPRSPLSSALLCALFAVALAAPVAAKPALAGYVPDGANLFIEVSEPREFFERLSASTFWQVVEAPELSGMFETLDFAEPDFTDTMIGGMIPFEMSRWWDFVDGSVAIYNTHYGILDPAQFETKIEGTEVFHLDGAIIFEFDEKKADELRTFFREAVAEVNANAPRERERIGKIVIETYDHSFEDQREVIVPNQNWTQGMPPEEAYARETVTFTRSFSFQFAILEGGIAIWGEGSTHPVSKAIEAMEKSKATLDRNDRFKAMLDLLEGRDGSSDGIVAYVNLKDFQAYAEHGLNETELAARRASGLGAFLDAAVQLNVSDTQSIVQVAFGVADERAGMAGFVDRLSPVTTAAFDGTPESMDDVLAIGLDLGAWAKAGIAATSAEDPRSAGMIQMITMQGQTQLGLDPFETFLYPIGGTHVFARRLEAAEGTDPAASLLDGVMAQTTGGTFGNAILSLGVANSSAMADALKTAANKLLELIGQEIITSQRVGGTDVHTILSEPGSSTAILSLAAANNSLMIAATADSISQALATAAGDMKAFSSDRVFRRRMRGLPDGAFLLSYSRNLQMTPEEVSNLGETICNQLWSAGLYSQEKVRAAYEVYSKQPATEEKLDFRVDNRGWATWNGRHLLLRTDMTPIRE